MADLIVSEQSPARVMEVRAKFYELLSHCIPPTVILKVCFEARVSWRLLIPISDRSRACCGESGREPESGRHALGSFLRQSVPPIFEVITDSSFDRRFE